MSDGDEYQYEWPDDNGDGEEGWGDENDEEDGETNPKIEIENNFYEAEGNMKDTPQAALEQFEKCVQLEEEQGDEIEHRFKAIEYIIILQVKLKQYEKVVVTYTKLLGMISKVARNDVSDAVNNILDVVSRFMGDRP
jgi:hypothetical protein